MVIQLTITGHPYVKKSNQKVVYNPHTKRSVKYDTPSYKNWHQSALDQLQALGYNPEFKKRNAEFKAEDADPVEALIDFPVNLQCRFYMKNRGRCDLSALYEGIQDVLVEVGILEDDRWSIVASHDGSGVEVDSRNPRMEITITDKETI